MPHPPAAAPPEPRRLHVLHVSASADDDIAHLTLDYVSDQVDRGWQVTVVCPSTGWLGHAARQAGSQVHWWAPVASGAAGPRLLGVARRLSRIIAEVRPDVAHLHGARAGHAGRAVIRSRVPTVYQAYGRPVSTDLPGSRRAARWERWAARWTSELVCLGRREAAHARAVVDGGRAPHPGVSLLGCGIDVTRWRAAGPGDRDAGRREVGEDDGPIAVCVGRLSASGGQRDLVEAWPDVRRRVPGARVVLVGDGPDRAALARLAAQQPGVRLVSARADPADWLSAADVVVVPARAGGPPLPALRAMATGRCVVVTRVGSLAETVPAQAGAVVEPGDPGALAAAVARRLGDPAFADEEGWRGRLHVERHHDSVTAARELARIYPRLVAAHRT